MSLLPMYDADGVRPVRTDGLADEFVACAATARTRLWLSMFLVGLTTDDSQAAVLRVLKELVLAAARGVDVRLLVDDFVVQPEGGRPNAPASEWLARRDVAVRTSGVGRRRSVHAKYLVADDNCALIGSGNLTPGALTSNAELALLVRSRQLTQSLAGAFEREWERARPWRGVDDILEGSRLPSTDNDDGGAA
jgi:phosphatidylserine/phosphatidylglycerophosphate/cardiolipin synthase-like enzyme